MTESEFTEFFDEMVSVFYPDIRSWLKRSSEQGTPWEKILGQWHMVLSGVSTEEAEAAMQEVYANNPDPGAFFRYERLPALIRDIARRKRAPAQTHRHFTDGEESYRCLKCQDDGRLIVWHYEAMKLAHPAKVRRFKEAVEAGEVPRRGLGVDSHGRCGYTMAVACDCEAGEQYSRTDLARYEPGQFLITNPILDKDEAWGELVNWVKSKSENRYESVG